MKKTLIVCLGLILLSGLALAETADRAPATRPFDLEKKVDVSFGNPVAGKGVGGPDAYGYRWIDSNEPGGPVYNWIDITGTGTGTALGDDGEFWPINFSFTFYGQAFTQVGIGSNGGLFFTSNIQWPYSNTALPWTGGRFAIMPLWEDLYQTVNTNSPFYAIHGDTLIVEWYCRRYSSAADTTFFEVLIINKGTNDADIIFQYQQVDDAGVSSTVGIQGDSLAATNYFLQYSYNTASITNGLAIKFYTYVPQPGDLALQSIDEPSAPFIEPGLPFTPAATVGNPGTTPVSNFQVVYSIDDGTTKALVYEDTVDVAGPLDPGATIQATFDDFTPLDMSNYYVTAYVSAAGDPYADNDTIHFYFRTFNELVGYVGDDNNGGAPVDGATITATGPATYVTTTNSEGNYFFFDMTAGTYTVTASKTGYLNEVITGVTVNDNMQTTLDLSMGYPVLTLTPTDSIYLTLQPDQIDNTTWQFQLANDGSRDMTYSVSWPEVTKGPKALGDSLWGLDVETPCGSNLCLGVEYALGHIWVTNAGASSSSGDNYLVEIDPATGGVINTFTQPAASSSGWGWRDLAFDGTYLYASYSTVIDQINPATGAVTGTTIPSPQNPGRALAYNPSNDHFYVANFASNIYEITRAGTIVNQWANTKSIYGLAYDGDNPAGPSLWVWSQDGTPAVQASRFDLTTGTYGSETWQGNIIGSGSVAGGATITDQIVPGYLTLLGLIQDTPDRLVAYELRVLNCDWLNVSPAAGTVPAYDGVVLDVTFNSTGLAVGDYAANVTFNTNAASGKRQDIVPAYLHVTTSGVSGGTTTPLAYTFGLNANRPNPVRGKTTFSFSLPKAQDYTLKVYNIAGQQVATFAGKGRAGVNSVNWDAGKSGAGVYFYQLISGGMSATRKLVVIK